MINDFQGTIIIMLVR